MRTAFDLQVVSLPDDDLARLLALLFGDGPTSDAEALA